MASRVKKPTVDQRAKYAKQATERDRGTEARAKAREKAENKGSILEEVEAHANDTHSSLSPSSVKVFGAGMGIGTATNLYKKIMEEEARCGKQ